MPMRLSPPPARPAVLVVDDGDDARDGMARVLRRGGYDPVTAADGPAALAIVDAGGIGLVLLDLTMPGMDGLEVLRRLRANPRHRGLPVVLFTAVDDPGSMAEARRLGAAEYVVKGGVGMADLFACVDRHLRRQRAA